MSPAPPPPAIVVGAQATDSAGAVPAGLGLKLGEERVVRDRIVVLGRTRSGKTVYIARLYHLLYRVKDELSMRACSGATHSWMAELWQALSSGHWPAPTNMTLDSHAFELTFRTRKLTMVISDYSGELFDRAFVKDSSADAAARELLQSVDRAQAIIFLLDPLVILGESLAERTNQEFGHAQAIRQLRTTPGGECVPITLVVTKYDLVREQLKAAGNVRMFLQHHYPVLVGAASDGDTKVCHCTAVQSRLSVLGKDYPDWDAPVRNVEEPLRACLEIVVKNLEEAEARTKLAAKRRIEAEEMVKGQEQRGKERSLANWVMVICFLILALTIVGGWAWLKASSPVPSGTPNPIPAPTTADGGT